MKLPKLTKVSFSNDRKCTYNYISKLVKCKNNGIFSSSCPMNVVESEIEAMKSRVEHPTFGFFMRNPAK